MTYAELKRAMPWAGEHFLRANCEGQSPEPERPVRRKPLAKIKAPTGGGQRFAVHITSHRRRLIDPDNLCGKHFVDALRYAGLIPDDTAELMDYHICQQRVFTKEEERTEIQVQEISS